jgi:hypothetical protein
VLIYWAFFSILAIISIAPIWQPLSHSSRLVEIALMALLTIFVGFRFEIGVDWATYQIIFYDLNRLPLIEAIQIGDPAYALINWLVGELGGAVWHVNLICGAIFAFALVRFCRLFEFPAVAMLAVFPLLIVITAMGYTRQATAIAFVMIAIVSFDGRFSWRWLGWLSVGLLFHRSVFILFPLFIFSASRNRITSFIIGGIIGGFLLLNVVLRGLSETINLYIGGDLESSGTTFRIAIGAFVAALMFFIPNRQAIFGSRYLLWRNMCLFSFALVPLTVIAPSATIIDRTGILLIPLQAAVFGALVTSQKDSLGRRLGATIAAVSFAGAILGGWLVYAQFASYWLPYRNVLWEPFL